MQAVVDLVNGVSLATQVRQKARPQREDELSTARCAIDKTIRAP